MIYKLLSLTKIGNGNINRPVIIFAIGSVIYAVIHYVLFSKLMDKVVKIENKYKYIFYAIFATDLYIYYKEYTTKLNNAIEMMKEEEDNDIAMNDELKNMDENELRRKQEEYIKHMQQLQQQQMQQHQQVQPQVHPQQPQPQPQPQPQTQPQQQQEKKDEGNILNEQFKEPQVPPQPASPQLPEVENINKIVNINIKQDIPVYEAPKKEEIETIPITNDTEIKPQEPVKVETTLNVEEAKTNETEEIKETDTGIELSI